MFTMSVFRIKEKVGVETDAYKRSMRKRAKVGGQFEGLDRLVHGKYLGLVKGQFHLHVLSLVLEVHSPSPYDFYFIFDKVIT